MEPEHQPSSSRRLCVLVSDARGRTIEPGLSRWLSRVAPPRARGTVSVAVVSDRRVRRLNQRYRGIDRPTDVLSFPAQNRSPRKPGANVSGKSRENASAVSQLVPDFLGDIVIARGVARRQAQAAGHSESTELKVLALHGLLHLLGYDHERDNGAMARLEHKLRRKGGLREGLIERR